MCIRDSNNRLQVYLPNFNPVSNLANPFNIQRVVKLKFYKVTMLLYFSVLCGFGFGPKPYQLSIIKKNFFTVDYRESIC